LNGWLNLNFHQLSLVVSLVIGETLLFLIGVVIFFSGVITLAKGRRRRQPLISSGIYRFIRHPQHLGLILMLLPWALYVPVHFRLEAGLIYSDDLGIRIGEIISWTLFSVLLVIISLLEERSMRKKHPEIYEQYQITTGFLLPLRRSKRQRFSPQGLHYDDRKQFIRTLLLVILCYLTFLVIAGVITTLIGESTLGWLYWTV